MKLPKKIVVEDKRIIWYFNDGTKTVTKKETAYLQLIDRFIYTGIVRLNQVEIKK